MAPKLPPGVQGFQKGVFLFKKGDPATHVFILQSGLVSVFERGPQGVLELYQATAPQILGAEALQGAKEYAHHGQTLNDTTALLVPVEQAKQWMAGTTPLLKLLAQTLLKKESLLTTEMEKVRLGEPQVACPANLAGKLFASIHAVADYTGQRKNPRGHGYLPAGEGTGPARVTWAAFRKYCHRVFVESPIRLEAAIYVLVKLDLCSIEMVKDESDPEGPEVLGFVTFNDLDQLRSFSDFFIARSQVIGMAHAFDPDLEVIAAAQALWNTLGSAETKLSAKIERSAAELASIVVPHGSPHSSDPVRYLRGLAERGLPIELRAEETETGARAAEASLTLKSIERMLKNFKILAAIHEWNQTRKSETPQQKRAS